ncbi:MAG: hypothetical protein HQL69_16980 [Magnetococcales bacterium]|nr:hypothetical protein [Magnetococcales bacterium]
MFLIICRHRPSETGSVLITVMITVFVTMLLAASIVNHFAVSEAREIENGLAKVRAYWAMSGVGDYTLSRARSEGLDGLDDSGMVVNLNSYVEELDPAESDQVYRFTYSDITAEYWLDIQGLVAEKNAGDNTGRTILTMQINDTGSVPAVSGLGSQVPSLIIDACVMIDPNPGSSECTTGVSGQSWIKDVYRQ